MGPQSEERLSVIQCMTKPENTLFMVQVTAILLVVGASVINLSLQTGNVELWTMILTASLGYLMPNPKFTSNPTLVKGVGEDMASKT